MILTYEGCHQKLKFIIKNLDVSFNYENKKNLKFLATK